MTRAIIKINGEAYDGWKSVSISRSIETISSSFSFNFTDSWSSNREPWGINPQDSCDILAGGTRLIRGYIDILNARLGTERSYTVQGRDKSADVVDCSAEIKQYKSISLVDLCNALSSPVGVSFSVQSPLINNAIFSSFSVDPGETIFSAIDRAVRMRGVLCVPDGNGNVVLSLAGFTPALVQLIEGENCKTASYTLDYSKRYSSYVVKGQDKSADGFFGTATTVTGRSSDEGVKRNRPMIIHADNRCDTSEARVRAAWEANVRAARSTKAEVFVQGWEQVRGRPWMINETVQLRAQKLGLSGKFLISDTEMSQDDQGGETTKLTLVPPDAFLSDPKVKKKKSDQVAKGFTF